MVSVIQADSQFRFHENWFGFPNRPMLFVPVYEYAAQSLGRLMKVNLRFKFTASYSHLCETRGSIRSLQFAWSNIWNIRCFNVFRPICGSSDSLSSVMKIQFVWEKEKIREKFILENFSEICISDTFQCPETVCAFFEYAFSCKT